MRTLRDVTPTADQLAILLETRPRFPLIRGAAGSGKTTTALLRLRQLCGSRLERRTRQGTTEPVRVLVPTFNRTLRGYISQLATEHLRAADGLDLTVETFGRWAHGLVGGRVIPDGDGSPVIAPLLGWQQVGYHRASERLPDSFAQGEESSPAPKGVGS